jgi:hypothetical protein
VNTAEVESYHDLGRLEEGIHHVPGLRRTDCSHHFVQIVWILGEGDLQLADCQVQEGLVCQRLVACDAIRGKELVKKPWHTEGRSDLHRHRHRNCQKQHLYFVHQVQKEVFRHSPMVQGLGSGLVNVADQWSLDLESGLGLKSRTEMVEVCYEKQQVNL